MQKESYNFKKLTFIFLFIGLLSSCMTVRLISDYDEMTDKTINALQEDVSRLLINVENNLGSDKSQYSNYIKNYEDIHVKLKVLQYRANATDKNKIILSQVTELINIMDNIEKLHKMGFQNKEQLLLFEQPLNSAFGAMIKLQLALKRGTSNPSK